MTYNPRITAQFKDFKNIGTWVIKITQNNYAGAETEIEHTAPIPFILTYGDPTRWPLEPLIMSDCEISFWSAIRFEFKDLVTGANSVKNRVEITRDGATFWKGYIISDLYTEPLELIKTPLRFQAADLKLLENFTVTLTGIDNNPFDYIRHLLNKLNFDYDYRVSIAITTELGIGKAFNQTLLNSTVFNGLNGLEAMRKLLLGFGAQLRQKGGMWYITQIAELSGVMDYIDYDQDGAEIGNGTTNPAIATTDTPTKDVDVNFCQLLPGGEIQELPALKEFTIKTKLFKNETFIQNPNFEDYTPIDDVSGTFDYWNNTTPVFQREKDDETFVVIKSVAQPSNQFNINQTVANFAGLFINNPDQKFKISFKYGLLGSAGTADVTANIKLGDLFLSKDGEWITGEELVQGNAIIFYNQPAQPFGEFALKSFEITAPVADGDLKITFYAPAGVSGGAIIAGTCFTNVNIEILDNTDTQNPVSYPDEISETTEINVNNNYTPDDIELLFDIPGESVPNTYEIFTNLLAPNFPQIYKENSGTLAQLLAFQIKDMLSTAPLYIKCTLTSDIFLITSVLTDIEFPGNRFIPMYAIFNPRLLEWKLQLIAINGEQIPDFYGPDSDGGDFFTGE